MNKNEFMELVKDKVLDVLREKDSTLNAIIEKVTKSNGVLYCGLSFRGKDAVQPVIYLDDFYNRFEAGTNIDDIVNQVVDIYVSNRINDIDIGSITDFESVKDKCSYITPVPGGVGPMTVAMLSKNILKAYKLQR